ncbi:magnesium protoporphyrin IX methyltransferase [Sediminicoccus sp. KRV36]|uniref:magnesium protoporphyrin IX methyltransferase n=1 Tax=Sediminicoccus sp. KRV36 TaxID=3133721 RepID=UPI00200E1D54|nr:magnesium protoporphyrin IX methyltransferase [Sediminicoccus rosea]UPY35331.1 magnesium protoporphyrin IX methyltransferase [Sediminicoccus rosea]
MQNASYTERRGKLEAYFDRTAAVAWQRLTSDAPVSGIRATVRAGREEMRNTLLSWLPADMTGLRVLDAGCGTGALASEAAMRGAEVVAVDLSPTLVACARERALEIGGPQPEFHAGDMLGEEHGEFDHIVAMDSLIHYDAPDIVAALARAAKRCRRSMLFTVAPNSPMLSAMITVGRLFPRGDRAPFIAPLAESKLRRLIAAEPALRGFTAGRHRKVQRGFYTSQAYEWVRA